jgi:Fe-S oxidoreductase
MTEATTQEISTEFIEKLVSTVPDGERIRLCLQCGSCSGVCPFGHVMEFPPHGMIAALRAGIFDQVLKSDAGWMCISCYACTEICPANIPVTAGLTTALKEELILAGDVPAELQEALENAQRYFNPLGESPRKRADWIGGIEPEIRILRKTKEPVDVLWYVGDYPSYHPRAKEATIALAKILNALGVDFGILGPDEVSDGDSLRMAGETGLFEMLAEKNARAIGAYEFKEIITGDPHAYNAYRNEYPRLDISYPVRHYTQFLDEHLKKVKSLAKNPIDARVVFHDPCYLGRVNSVYDEPRRLLQAIPGVELVEMAHHREHSLCCGGGGGGMWLDGFQWEKAEARVSEWRVREAVTAVTQTKAAVPSAIGAKKTSKGEEDAKKKTIMAIACPYEAPRFEDATKTVPGAEGLLVREIAELLAESMGLGA